MLCKLGVSKYARSFEQTLPYLETQETVLDCRILFLCVSSPRVRAGAGPVASSSFLALVPEFQKLEQGGSTGQPKRS